MSDNLGSRIIEECFNPKKENGEIVLYIDFEPSEILVRYGIEASREPEHANENAEKIVKILAKALKNMISRIKDDYSFSGKTVIVEDGNAIGEPVIEPNLDKLFTDILEEYIYYLQEHINDMPPGSKPREPKEFLNSLEEHLLHARGSL